MVKDYSVFCGYHIGKVDESKKKVVNYILTGSGVYEMRKNEIGTFVVKADKVVGLETMETSFNMELPKIPIDYLFKIIGFFKAVNKKFNSEAMIQIYWDRTTKQYFCHCPKQEVTSGAVDFTRDVELDKQHLLVMDIHSHNTMDAFFSGTDTADEKETRIFGVIGKVTDATPAMKFRASVAGKFIEDLSVESMFNVSTAFEKQWLEKISERKYVTYENAWGNFQGGLIWDWKTGTWKTKKESKNKHSQAIGYGSQYTGDLYDDNPYTEIGNVDRADKYANARKRVFINGKPVEQSAVETGAKLVTMDDFMKQAKELTKEQMETLAYSLLDAIYGKNDSSSQQLTEGNKGELK